MSRTTRIDSQENPAIKMLKWKSSEGTFQYWDKDLEQNVNLEIPFKFAVLEEKYVSFTGYSESEGKGFWSNEVKDKNQMVQIKCGDKVVKTFKKEDWKNVKNEEVLKGCKYTQILYVASDFEGDWNIYRIMLNGSAFTGGIIKDKKTGVPLPSQENDGWMSFMKQMSKEHGKNALYDRMIVVTGSKPKKNGAVTFMIPEFDSEVLTEEQNEQFNQLAESVDNWFMYYNNKDIDTKTNEEEAVPFEVDEDPAEI